MNTKSFISIKGKLTVLFMMTFYVVPSWTQETDAEFYPQGTIWEEAWFHLKKDALNIDGTRDTIAIYTYLRYTIDSDSTVNDTVYKKVKAEKKVLDSYSCIEYDSNGPYSCQYVVDPDSFDWDNTGAYHWERLPSNDFLLREEDRKVYIRYDKYGNNEKKMYDFNWEEGKEIEEWSYDSKKYEHYTLNNIETTTLLDGTKEKCTMLYDGEIYSIRGIGCCLGLFKNLGEIIYDGSLQFAHLLSFSRNGKDVYKWDASGSLESMIPKYYSEGTSWEEAFFHYGEGDNEAAYTYLRHTVVGDTIVNDTVYKKVKAEKKVLDNYAKKETDNASYYSCTYEVGNADFSWNTPGPYHWEPLPSNDFCIREKGWKVFIRYWKYGEDEKMVYDFNWLRGRKISEWNYTTGTYESRVLNDMKEATFNNDWNELYLSEPQSDEVERIRTIGAVTGLFKPLGEINDDGKPQFAHLLSFTREGEVIYEWNADEMLGIDENACPIHPVNTPVYSISGVRINAKRNLSKGIYIINGRKLVIR